MTSKRSWFRPASPQSLSRGMPTPMAQTQTRRAAGDPRFDVPPAPDAGYHVAHNRRSSMGMAGVAPQYGKVFYDPIGNGVVATHRPQSSYGMSGQYMNHAIWWSQQTIPTTIPLGPLTSASELEALLGTVNVQAVVNVG